MMATSATSAMVASGSEERAEDDGQAPPTRSSVTSNHYGFEQHRLATISGWNHVLFLTRKKNKKDKKRSALILEGSRLARHFQNMKMPTSVGSMRRRSDLLGYEFESWCESIVKLHTREEVLALVKEDMEKGNFDYEPFCITPEMDPQEVVDSLWDYPTVDLDITTANPRKAALN